MDLKPKTSLLAAHRKILGYDSAPLSADELAEQARVERIGLPQLDWSSDKELRSSSPWSLDKLLKPSVFVPTLAAALVAVFLMIFSGSDGGQVAGDGDTLRFKGESKVWMYFERAGVAWRVTPDTVLHNGDRVRVEVLAADSGVAYMAVTNNQHELLSSAQTVLGRALTLEGGETKAFEGSVELVGTNEGETIVVVICREPLDHGLLKEFMARNNEPLVRNQLPSTCAVEALKLR